VEIAAKVKTRNAAALASAPAAPRFDPIVRDLEGWQVYIEPALLDGEYREEGAQALKMLANHFQRIKILLPAKPLARLQQAGIWVEHSHPELKFMQYHPCRDWLVAHGYDPRLEKKVHIPQARHLLSRAHMLREPASILHELAHAYHDQVLGYDHSEIMAAYEKAKASGAYENVLLFDGQRGKHYALTTPQEYFAEATEAYFYHNDFYPFVRAELQEHDPAMCALIGRLWGVNE
jgi:dipeptidyl-peptidase-4